MHVIEFFGMLGAGKTTVATRVQRQLEAQGVVVIFCDQIDGWIATPQQQRAGRMPLRQWLASARMLWRAGILALSVRPWRLDHFRRARRLAGWYRRTLYLAGLNERGRGLAIQEEGVLHLLLALAMHGSSYSPSLLAKLVRLVALEPHRIFIYVRTDPELVLQRRRKRAGLREGEPARLWRYSEANLAEERRMQEDMQQMHDRVDRAIDAVAPDRRLVVNCDRSADEAAAQVIRFLRQACDLPVSESSMSITRSADEQI